MEHWQQRQIYSKEDAVIDCLLLEITYLSESAMSRSTKPCLIHPNS